MKSKEVEEFIEENCLDCKKECEWGIRENYYRVWCPDIGVVKEKKNIDF